MTPLGPTPEMIEKDFEGAVQGVEIAVRNVRRKADAMTHYRKRGVDNVVRYMWEENLDIGEIHMSGTVSLDEVETAFNLLLHDVAARFGTGHVPRDLMGAVTKKGDDE